MRTGTLVALFCLAAASARADLFSAPDEVGGFRRSDAVAEVTIVAARLNTYRVQGKDLVCGQSYDAVVNDVVTGKLGRRISFGERIWFPRENALRDLDRDSYMSPGNVHLIGLRSSGADDYRDPKTYAQDFPAQWETPGFRACLKTLPRTVLGPSLRVYRADESFPTGMPESGRTYVRIFTTRSVHETGVFGAFLERYYEKTPGTVDPAARSYLTDDGVFPPPEAKKSAIADGYLKDVGRNGSGFEFEMAVDYETFKHWVLDPNYESIERFN